MAALGSETAEIVGVTNARGPFGYVAGSEVADLLGFAEQSSFNRAFRRWSGQTPTEYRGRTAAV